MSLYLKNTLIGVKLYREEIIPWIACLKFNDQKKKKFFPAATD